jgi:hypothetical protein
MEMFGLSFKSCNKSKFQKYRKEIEKPIRLYVEKIRVQINVPNGMLEVCIGQVRSGQWRKKSQNIS